MALNSQNRKIFEDARDHLDDASLKNSEQFDKAILSLSSAGLALSLSFTKFIKPLAEAENIFLLKISWILFGLAIIATVISFICTSNALSVEREHIYKYYIEAKDEYGDKGNVWGNITYWLNIISAAAFVFAMTTTVSYVWTNFN